jgi:hypothetical protein
MENIVEYLPFLVPIAVIELILIVAALVHAFKHDKYRFGNRILWVIIIIAFQMLGPILYFTVGRGED